MTNSPISVAFDRTEFTRWRRQAADTLKSAQEDGTHRRFNWSCFKAQQAAEYAAKGLLYGLGASPTGHSLVKLLGRLQARGLRVGAILPAARILDRHYIPTRYPNAHPEGAPFEYYDEAAAEEALESAAAILDFVDGAARQRRSRP